MPDHDTRHPDGGTDLLNRTTTQLKPKRPSLYKVVLANDDFTPVELVLIVLQQVFKMDAAKAYAVMEAAHIQGRCICGVYTNEIAETLALEATQLAKAYDFALLFTVEKD